jgi:hypothetical protein
MIISLNFFVNCFQCNRKLVLRIFSSAMHWWTTLCCIALMIHLMHALLCIDDSSYARLHKDSSYACIAQLWWFTLCMHCYALMIIHPMHVCIRIHHMHALLCFDDSPCACIVLHWWFIICIHCSSLMIHPMYALLCIDDSSYTCIAMHWWFFLAYFALHW